jgi:hypothetical protein
MVPAAVDEPLGGHMRKTALLSLIFCAGLAGLCASARQPQSDDFFSEQKINSIAVLPPMGDSVSAQIRGLSGDLFITKMKEKRPGLHFLASDDTLATLQKKKETDDFNAVIATVQTGTANPTAIKRIGVASGMDSVLLIHVLSFDEQKGRWYEGKESKNLCKIQYMLYKSSTGEKLWDSTETVKYDKRFSNTPEPTDQVITNISDKAAAALMAAREDSDDAAPQKKTKGKSK